MKILVLGKREGARDDLRNVAYSPSLYLVRYHPDGTIDNSFGDFGKLKLGSFFLHENSGNLTDFLVSRDGKLVVTQGWIGVQELLLFVQFTSEGEIDPTFLSTPTRGLLQVGVSHLALLPFFFTMPFDKYFVSLGRSEGRAEELGPELFWLKVLSDGKIDSIYRVSLTGDKAKQRYPRAIEDGTGRVLTIFTEKGQKDPTLFRILADGKLDPIFGEKGKPLWELKAGENSSFAATLVQSSEKKVLAVGTNKGDFALMRYNEDGTLDAPFGTDGKVITAIAGGGSLQDALVTDEGKILGAGTTGFATQGQAILVKWNKDGSLDLNFGNKGITKSEVGDAAVFPNRLAQDPKGNIYLVGYPFQDSVDTSIRGYDFGITRYLPNGTIDSSFGKKGKVETGMGLSHDSVAGVIFQPDGKIVVAGTVSNGDLLSQSIPPALTLARFLEDGTIDGTFGIDGRIRPKSRAEVTRDMASQMKTMPTGIPSVGKGKFNDRTAKGVGCGIILQDDGKLVMSGCSQTKLVRYLPNGTLDSGFTDGDEPGIVKFDFGRPGGLLGTPITPPLKQSDGNLLVAGTAGKSIVIARVDPSGSLDKSFADQGLATHKIPIGDTSVPTSLFFQTDGKILVGGHWGIILPTTTYPYAPLGLFLLRTQPNGQIDPSFGINGIVTKELGEGSEIRAAQIQSDGKIVVVGWSSTGGPYTEKLITLLRFSSDGAPDPTFGKDGMVKTNVIAGNEELAKSMLILPDGRILIAGSCYQIQELAWYALGFQRQQWMMALYKSNGELDTTFGTNGILKLFPDLGSEASAITMRSDGLIAVAGSVTGTGVGPSGDSDILVALFSMK